MGTRRLTIVLTCVLVAALTPFFGATAAPANDDKIDAGLLASFERTGTTRFIVEFAARADLEAAARIPGERARGNAVYRALTRTADSSQAAARLVAQSADNSAWRSYWLTNTMFVTGDRALARRFAALPDVAAVRLPGEYPLIRPVGTAANTIAALEDETPWGILKVRADEAWSRGVLGSGVVVANVDTGVDFTHPAIVEQYRGNLGPDGFVHDYNWWDPTGICGDEPCDNNSHGTHTMGTMVGGDGPGPFTPDIGVAPGARWIAAKGCEESSCSEEALTSSGEFMVAPTDSTGGAPDPSRRPDIVNNSWGGGPGDPFYEEVVSAWRAAGIVPVFASGNPGPTCGDAGSPGDYLDSFAVGATDSDDVIAEFSGRGPSSFGKPTHPDVSAPGVDVVSSVPGGGFESFSGTSMATPHTVGTLALVLSAEPGLARQVDALEDVLRTTAVDRVDLQCGGDDDGDPNNVYGEGRIDAAAAVELVATGGTLAGQVTDAAGGAPISGARITASRDGRDYSVTADADGRYQLFLAEGTWTVNVESFGYAPVLDSGVVVVADSTTTHDVALAALPTALVTGRVRSAEGRTPLRGVAIKAVGTPVRAARTDRHGNYQLRLPIGTYTLRANGGGCTETVTREVVLPASGARASFRLFQKVDDFGYGCAPVSLDWVEADHDTALFGNSALGRLRLPFGFSFYGTSYDTVYLSDDGYLTFVEPPTTGEAFEFKTIPSPDEPNAAIYLFGQNLNIGDDATLRYATKGSSPNRTFVLEWNNVSAGRARLDLEVLLHENGTFDLVYGADNPENPGDGRDALIGTENEDGSVGFEFSFGQATVTPGAAFRFERVPTGILSGRVLDLNDGQPIVGATVTTSPGGVTATTSIDGRYRIRVRPGGYDLEARADGYISGIRSAWVHDGEEERRTFRLAAPRAEVRRTNIEASAGLGESVQTHLTLRNPGTAPLTWELRERDRGVELPDLPPVPEFTRPNTWEPAAVPAGTPVATVRPTLGEDLDTVIEDPEGDSLGIVDVIALRGGADGEQLSVAVDYSDTTPIDIAVGYVQFDTDQDPTTGFEPSEQYGTPNQDIGIDYFAELFSVHFDGTVPIYNSDFELVATVPGVIEGQTIAFDVPLEALGSDDGSIDVVMNTGSEGPEDWAPDAGHGTIEPFRDVTWLEANPAAGAINAGGRTRIDLVLTAALTPGTHRAEIVILSDAPRAPRLTIPVVFEVVTPPDFGALSGALHDAEDDSGISGTVALVAEWRGAPYEPVAVTGNDGTYLLFGPAGTWPVTFSAPGYETLTIDATISAGHLSGLDAALRFYKPSAAIEGGPIDIEVAPGEAASVRLRLRNDGIAPLEFEVSETPISGGDVPVPGTQPRSVRPLATEPSAHTTAHAPSARRAGAIAPVAAGDVITSWPTGLLPFGVGVEGDGSVLISAPEESLDARFTPDGTLLAAFETPWAGEWAADIAVDRTTGTIWQLAVGGDDAIHGLDSDGNEIATIAGPWTSSQRGLAYDPTDDVFYVGGWNEGVIYTIAGPSHPTPGESLGECIPADRDIAGLGWNDTFGLLWETTNSESDTIYLLDPTTCEAQLEMPHPGGGGFSGGGIETDAVGNLWTVSQAEQMAFLIESELPEAGEVPWLDTTPIEGEVAPSTATELTVDLNASELEAGEYHAAIIVTTNDPDARVLQVPVRFVVLRSLEAIDAGGPGLTDRDGIVYRADREYGVGNPSGYVGGSSVSTDMPIEGTDDDALYQTSREGPAAYRFDVADGEYRVVLQFAEPTADTEFARVFSVRAEGDIVVKNLDVWDAGAGRPRVAVDREIVVEVTDGTLDLEFVAKLGGPPIVSAIVVRGVPAGVL